MLFHSCNHVRKRLFLNFLASSVDGVNFAMQPELSKVSSFHLPHPPLPRSPLSVLSRFVTHVQTLYIYITIGTRSRFRFCTLVQLCSSNSQGKEGSQANLLQAWNKSLWITLGECSLTYDIPQQSITYAADGSQT